VFIFVKNIKMTNTEIPQINGQFSPAQLEILKVMSRPVSDEDLRAIKKLIIRYFADKLSDLADEAWERNGWTAEDEQRLLNTHMRTPYLPKIAE
jgi:hypothetical protein